MNQRVLVAGTVRVGDPARTLVSKALAEITGLDPDVFELRLSDDTPWLLDLPNEAEAKQLARWAFSAAGLKTTIVPAVGPPAPSRSAGLAWLEQQVHEAAADARDRIEQQNAEHARRQELAREKARALAGKGAPARPGMPESGLELDSPGTRRRGGGPSETVEAPHPELNLRRERSGGTRLALGAAIFVAVALLFGPPLAAPWLEGRLHDGIADGLRSLAVAPAVNGRLVRQEVALRLRDGGDEPEAFEIGVFVAPDAMAAQLEADRGLGTRAPEEGVRLRARARGETAFLFRKVNVDVYADVLIPQRAMQGAVEPYTGDFIRLDVR